MRKIIVGIVFLLSYVAAHAQQYPPLLLYTMSGGVATPVTGSGTVLPGGNPPGFLCYGLNGSGQPAPCSFGSGTFNQLTGDASSTATGGATEVIGLLNHALPSLTTGYLNWTGSAWALSAVSGGSAFPLTVSGTVTSGGIPYFNSTTQESSSALLATNALVVGGGAGGAPATGNGDFTYATHTLTAGASGILNLSAASTTAGLLLPSAAGAIPTADGQLAFNTTTHALVVGSNTTTIVEAAAATGTNTATTCTNQVITAISAIAAPTCTSLTTSFLPTGIPNANLATQTANTVLGALTATTPSGLAMPSCSGASNALIWTSGTGFGCNTITGSGGTTTNALTINNGGSGAASGTTFNGASAVTLSYNTIGAAPTASPTFTGTVTTPLTTAGLVTTSSGGVLSSEANATIAQGGTNATSAPSTGAIPNTSSTTAASWTVTPTLGNQNTTAGGLTIAGSAAAGGSMTLNGDGASPGQITMTANAAGTAVTFSSTGSSNVSIGTAGSATGTLTLESATATGGITLTPASAASQFTVTVPAATDTLVNLAGTQTLSNKTVDGLTLTALTTGFSVAGGTTSKTLTVSNTMTLAGTDASTYTFPGASATMTQTIASGTSALGTGAITSGACATTVTTAATGTATTDVVGWGFNGNPTAVTGYTPTVNGMLTIIAWPTSGNVNFAVCNNTSASVTPGAITLNWRITR